MDTVALNHFLESIRSYAPDLIFGPPSGQPLYHYTDLGGLNGIITSHDLWLTHSRYSNDEAEMTHGYGVARQVVDEVRAETSQSAPAIPQNAEMLTYLDLLTQLLEERATEGAFICCFCQRDNLLSQWRSYGANGVGVSLQMDPQQFSYISGPDSPPGGLMRLWKVFYEPDRQQRILRQAIDFGFKNPFAPGAALPDRARQAADAIQFFIPTFKNEDFSEEQEWRLIFTPSQLNQVPLHFRVARGMLVPYFSLKELSGGNVSSTALLPITGARVGPSTHSRLNVTSVQTLLRQAGYSQVNVDESNTPFRG